MTDRTVIVAVLVLAFALFLFSAGCTTQPPKTTGTVSTTKAPSTQPSTPPSFPVTTTEGITRSGPGTPSPTEALPDIYSLDFQVQSNGNTANPKVGVTLMGGKGMELDSRIDITFHRSNGDVKNATMLPPFSMGQMVAFDASPDNYNRVEIWVTAPQVGKIKTFDDYVPFSTYNSNP